MRLSACLIRRIRSPSVAMQPTDPSLGQAYKYHREPMSSKLALVRLELNISTRIIRVKRLRLRQFWLGAIIFRSLKSKSFVSNKEKTYFHFELRNKIYFKKNLIQRLVYL